MLLLQAADRIERDGWCQDRFFDDSGRLCAQGAIMFSAGVKVERLLELEGCEEWRAAANLLAEWIGYSIQEWNDMPGRTKGQVIDGLRKAAVHGL